MNGNRKLFWNEVSKVSGGKMENSNRIMKINGRLILEKDEVRRIWKEYHEYDSSIVAINIVCVILISLLGLHSNFI